MSTVYCDACGIELNPARAENAREAAPDHAGAVMCGACRDCARLRTIIGCYVSVHGTSVLPEEYRELASSCAFRAVVPDA